MEAENDRGDTVENVGGNSTGDLTGTAGGGRIGSSGRGIKGWAEEDQREPGDVLVGR